MEERKLVTVLFADITGSTSLGERFDPERWRTLLQRFFSVMAASIEAWGGTVQKFAGDAVMATFGVPIVREDDAERALWAACEMLERLNQLNVEFQAKHNVTLAIRIGVNTGDVMAAPDQLMVIGDAVNVAARLEQAADPGSILAGERTYEAARSAFVFGEPALRNVRGKAAPLFVRQVLRPLPHAVERRPGLQVPLVGREAEVETLARLFHEVMDTGTPRMALVLGPAGIGKSRLVKEFLNLTAARHPERLLMQGRCPSAGQGLTYWALGELLRRECGISLDDPGIEAGDRLRSRVGSVLQGVGLPEADIERTINALAFATGIQLPDNPLENVRPSAVALEMGMAWPRFISAYTAKAPLILLIEDLHWADERLVAMLEQLLARSTGPLLMVGTARPEFRQANSQFGAGRDDVDFLMLRSLTLPQTAAMLDELLQRTRIDEGLRDELAATAGGNPFFLEEIIQRLQESAVLVHEDGQWHLTTGSVQSALPDSVQTVLAARIDALTPQQKRALQQAAVIGRIFWEGPLHTATGDPDLTSTLLGLERKGLVSIRPTSTISGDLEFSFKHALVRDVAYASLPMSQRARAHARAAEWLERTAGDRAEEMSELVAHHYRNALKGEGAELAWVDDPNGLAELRRRAFEALLLAGERARKRYAIPQALELHQEALALGTTPADRLRVLEMIGDDHEGAFHGDEAVPAWQQAIALIDKDPEQAGERVRLLVKCAKMACLRWGGFKVVPPTRQVDGYVDQALAAGPKERDRGWLLGMRAYLNTRKGNAQEIEAIPSAERARAGEEAVAIGRKLGDVDLQVLAIRALSGIAFSRRDFARAMDMTRQELELCDRITATRDRALSLVFCGLRTMDIEGNYEEGLRIAQLCYALGKQLTVHEVMHATYLLLCGNALLRHWSAIEPLLEEHLQAWRQEEDMSCPFARGGPLVGAWALAQQSKTERAREILAMKLTDWEAPSMPEAWHAYGMLACSDAQQARDEARRILASKRRLTYEEAPFEYLVMIRALIALGDTDALAAFLPEAQAIQGSLSLLGPACAEAAEMLKLRSRRAGEARIPS
jgi:class 3 adenylate cyclase